MIELFETIKLYFSFSFVIYAFVAGIMIVLCIVELIPACLENVSAKVCFLSCGVIP